MNQSVTHLETPEVQTATPRPRRRVLAVALAVVVLALALASYFLFFATPSVTTDNAYVDAPVVSVTAQVSGQVAELAVKDNQHVQKGDLLLQIDPRPFQIALAQAEANLALARQGVSQTSAAIRAAEAEVQEHRSDLAQARADAARAHRLAPQGYLSREDIEKADTRVRTLGAELAAANARLEQAHAQLGRDGDDNVNVKAAQAAVDAARLKLEYTRITAPFSGTVSNLSLENGSMVQSGLPLFALIGDHEIWVDANFKETQFNQLHPGLKAEIRVDMYPRHVFHGIVQSISGGAGTAFSLLPPQNATGNWVKVTQRVPVKIVITDAAAGLPLRIGTSADVKVLLD